MGQTSPDRAYPDRPQVGVGVVVVRGRHILLVRRGRAPLLGAWSLPGGRQELGETVLAAARRELREETHLEVDALVLAGHADHIQRDAAGMIEYHYTILDFAARYAGGEARASDDVTEVAWVTADDFEAYDLSPDMLRIVAAAQAIFLK